MSVHKSVTGRTRAEVVVGERGDVVVKVYRNDQCVNDFSLPAEKDLGVHAELRKTLDGNIEIWHDGPMGVKKLIGRWRNGMQLSAEPVAVLPGAAPEEG